MATVDKSNDSFIDNYLLLDYYICMEILTQQEFARLGGLAKKAKHPKSFSEMGKKSGEARRKKSKKK